MPTARSKEIMSIHPKEKWRVPTSANAGPMPTLDSIDAAKVLEALARGDIKDAGRCAQKLQQRNPGDPEAWHLAGLVAHYIGDNDGAAECISRAVALDAGNPRYHNNLGVVLRSCGRIDDALVCYQAAVASAPDFADAHSNLGAAWRLLGDPDAAVDSCRRAIRLAPNSHDAYFNLALAYQAMGLLQEAIRAFRKAVQIQGDHYPSWHNLGAALLGQNRFNQAALCFEHALAIKSDYADALNGLSHVRRIQKRLPEAITLAEKALTACPHNPDAVAHLAVLCQQSCDWNRLAEIESDLTRQTEEAIAEKRKPAETPLFNVGFRADPAINRAVACAWSQSVSRRSGHQRRHYVFDGRSNLCGRITVGYLSSDFRDHPVAHQTRGLFGAHDRTDFRIFCYSTGVDDGSQYRRNAERNCDKFTDIGSLDDFEAAELIHKDAVDILVDLNGHTSGNRLGVCALRPSPIQVTYLGFPGTSGADFFDYIITDRIVTPDDHIAHYSECPVFLPGSYMPADDSQPISDRPFLRSEAGLPEDALVFCSFNSTFKFDPVLFSVWMSVLKQVPESRLWLPGSAPGAMANLNRAAEACDLDPAKLVFAPRLPSKEEYLARLKLADLALDTRTYNGHVSTCDALWAGVPVLTMLGSHFASRVSASILTALDMVELITGSLEEYAAAAVRLATRPAELQRVREKLIRHRRTQPFFNTGVFVRHLEAAYRNMWRVYQHGGTPCRIDIEAGRTGFS